MINNLFNQVYEIDKRKKIVEYLSKYVLELHDLLNSPKFRLYEALYRIIPVCLGEVRWYKIRTHYFGLYKLRRLLYKSTDYREMLRLIDELNHRIYFLAEKAYDYKMYNCFVNDKLNDLLKAEIEDIRTENIYNPKYSLSDFYDIIKNTDRKELTTVI